MRSRERTILQIRFIAECKCALMRANSISSDRVDLPRAHLRHRDAHAQRGRDATLQCTVHPTDPHCGESFARLIRAWRSPGRLALSASARLFTSIAFPRRWRQ